MCQVRGRGPVGDKESMDVNYKVQSRSDGRKRSIKDCKLRSQNKRQDSDSKRGKHCESIIHL